MTQDQPLFKGANFIDLSIPLRFNGRQPNAYGVEPASSEACEYGDLVGDTRRGGSVNFERYTFIPHCNGTHTECVGHITHRRISVRDCLNDALMRAFVLSVQPESNSEGDLLITSSALETAVSIITEQRSQSDAPDGDLPTALIIRTMPNDESKLTREYGTDNPGAVKIPPYFSADAMQLIVDCGVKHLLVDVPSIDRIYDEGKLINHRIFWNVEEGSYEVNDQTRIHSTITELIYVPDDVLDGEYLLNLQIAPFETDAVPSRPVLLM